MNTTQSIQKWSIGRDVRLPKDVAEQAQFPVNEPLEVSIKNGSVLLTPVIKKKKVTLEILLANISPEDVGGELDWGNDAGAEIYDQG